MPKTKKTQIKIIQKTVKTCKISLATETKIV